MLRLFWKNKKKWVGRVLKLSLLFFGLFFLGGLLVIVYYGSSLPRPEKFTELADPQPTQIYDRTGTVLLYEIRGEEKRIRHKLAEFPDHLEQAVIATEDADFYGHFGVDVSGIFRAILTNIKTGNLLGQGGSTITQQLARSAFLSRDKSVSRKVKELILTLDLELRYSKDELLEFYLNQIPMGSNVYGMGAASEFYFGKPVGELTVGESATLAAMIQAPTYYSPHNLSHREDLLVRRSYVLDRMETLGFVSKEEKEAAQQEELAVVDPGTSIKAPHFVFEVLDSLTSQYGEEYLRSNGLRVITSLDWELQKAAQRAVERGAERNLGAGAHNAALVAINPKTGEVLAMVGSKNWNGEKEPADCTPGKDCLFDPQVNVATARQGRQPGSAFKPFVYVTAFQKGFSDETIVIDEETNFGTWGGEPYIPRNYDGKFRGAVTLRQALAQSLNIPAVKVLLQMAGLQDSIATAQAMGITTLTGGPSFYGPSLVLGAGEVRVLDMASAYGVFANEGKRVPPLIIKRIETTGGTVIQINNHSPILVIDPEAAKTMTSVLSDNAARAPLFGANSVLHVPGRTVAVKTGTTDRNTNAWTVGYTDTVSVGVWVGNNDNTPMRSALGFMVAAPIWRQFLDEAFRLGY